MLSCKKTIYRGKLKSQNGTCTVIENLTRDSILRPCGPSHYSNESEKRLETRGSDRWAWKKKRGKSTTQRRLKRDANWEIIFQSGLNEATRGQGFHHDNNG